MRVSVFVPCLKHLNRIPLSKSINFLENGRPRSNMMLWKSVSKRCPRRDESNEQEQSPEDREFKNDFSEQSPEKKIAETIKGVDRIDQEIFTAKKSIAETQSKLAALREGMKMPPGGDESPAMAFQKERIEKLEERRKELGDEKTKWIEQYGRENLPEGIVMEDDNNGREVKGWSREKNEEQERSDQEKKEDLEARKGWVKKWEKETVEEFETSMNEDWRTKDAVNLRSSIELMKLRAQDSMEKAFADFVDGKIDTPPFSNMSLKWRTSSLLDKLTGKPETISKLEIVFDEKPETLAEESDLLDKGGKRIPRRSTLPHPRIMPLGAPASTWQNSPQGKNAAASVNESAGNKRRSTWREAACGTARNISRAKGRSSRSASCFRTSRVD